MKRHDGEHCRELLEQLSLYIDGDLNARERRSIMAHLRRCPCCEDFAESLRRTVLVCQQAGQRQLPRDVRARARARIAELLKEQ